MLMRRTSRNGLRNGLGDALQVVSSQPTCPAGYTIDTNNQCQPPTTTDKLMSVFYLPVTLFGISTNENFAAPFIAGGFWLAAVVLVSSIGGGRR